MATASQSRSEPPREPQSDPSPVNTRVPDAPYYIPLTHPSTGTALSAEEYSKNKTLPKLFQPLKVRSLEFKNRIFVSPMCQYSAKDGIPSDWHLVHLGAFAVRGPGLVFSEATSVTPNGRITPEDLGIWSDDHIPHFKRIVDFIHTQGTYAGIQLAHAGRKASTYAPWVKPTSETAPLVAEPGKSEGWENVWGPSGVAYSSRYPVPHEMTLEDIEELKVKWKEGVERSIKAGFDVIEIHAAHGYLLHNFLSPISNKRTDKYGGSLENRIRLVLEIASITRSTFPSHLPVFLRISASDWDPHGEKDASTGEWISWGIEQSKVLVKEAEKLGIDFVDTSSGGNWEGQQIKTEPGYQVPFASALKQDPELAGLPIGAVGLITTPKQAEEILQKGEADAVLLARQLLRNADFVLDAAMDLGVAVGTPVQYQRAYTRMYN